MEEEKTQIVEKRLSRGVIRRRVRKKPAEEKISEKPKIQEEKITLDSAKAAPKVEAKEQPVETKAVKETPAPAKKAPSKKMETSEKKMVTEVGKEVIKASKKEDEEPLSFKDRIVGTISLDKFQPKKPVAAKSEASDKDSEERAKPGFREAADKQDPLQTKKAARVKKGVKRIGGDLDIEGQGRATTLTHITRTAAADRVFRPDMMRNRKKKIISKKKLKQTQITEKKASKRIVEMAETITVSQLAQQLGIKASEIIKKLMELGIMATINQSVDKDSATLIANDYEHEIKDISFKEDEVLQDVATEEVNPEDLQTRPPVVTIMGHVDHGKTSLLDAIRETNVTQGEAGGITQHIGAYTVSLKSGQITFLDTPGHEAFTAMRARGAKVTDIVILVVAADDGLMPQTEESIAHAQAAGVPLIVAINKIDKPDANPDKVLRELSEKGLLAESWGGDIQTVNVSAHTKAGLPELLENILLQSEILELKANPDKRAKGVVIEAQLDKFRGPVCSLLVQEGTLKKGDIVVAGTTWGKIKAMTDWHGKDVKEAKPSYAVEILGLNEVPQASESFHVVANEQDAKKVIDHRIEQRKQENAAEGKVSLEDMFSKMKEGEVQEFNILLKTDVHGSMEAVRDALLKIGNEEVKANIIHAGVGGIKESDIQLAQASHAAVIGFNVRPETKAIHFAKEKGIEIRLYKIIYELLDDMKMAMQGLLAPETKENYLGRAEVRQVFRVSKAGIIAGSMVVDGKITRNAKLRLLRDNVVLYEGSVATLKRFKDDAKEVAQGYECGIGLEGYQDIVEGDVLEAFEIEEIAREL